MVASSSTILFHEPVRSSPSYQTRYKSILCPTETAYIFHAWCKYYSGLAKSQLPLRSRRHLFGTGREAGVCENMALGERNGAPPPKKKSGTWKQYERRWHLYFVSCYFILVPFFPSVPLPPILSRPRHLCVTHACSSLTPARPVV